MRRDVLEHLAEEVGAHQSDPLASFTTWDEGRRKKLVGMARGRLRDLQRTHYEERAADRKVQVEIRRLMKMRARHRRPEVYRAQSRRAEAANKEKRAAQRKARYWKNRDKELAKLKRSRHKHKAKRNAEALAYYRAHREEALVRMREWSAANRPREGKRRCSVCRQPGHNVRRCPATTSPPPCPPARRARPPAAP